MTLSSEQKDFLNTVMAPKSIIIARESHTMASHYEWIAQNINGLNNNHYMGGVLIELPPYYNYLIWAYRDNNITEQELHAELEKISGNDRDDNADKIFADSLIKILNSGSDVFFYDARQTFEGFVDFLNSDKEMSKGYDIIQHIHQYELSRDDETETTRSGDNILVQIELNNPEYKVRLETLEQIIRDGKKRGIPEDIISAKIITSYTDENYSYIVIPGDAHISGHFLKNFLAQGILDEALNAQGRKVHDGYIGNSDDLDLFIDHWLFNNIDSSACLTSDKTDFVINTETGKVYTNDGSDDNKALEHFSCSYELETAEEYFGVENLKGSDLDNVASNLTEHLNNQESLKTPAAPKAKPSGLKR